MEIELNWFFEELEEEIAPLFKSFPWDPLKELKEFLYELISVSLPGNIPLNEPLREGIFLTIEGEALPLKEVNLIEKGRAEFRGEELEGAGILPGAIIGGRRIFLKKGAIVEAGAFLDEPAIIGEFTEL